MMSSWPWWEYLSRKPKNSANWDFLFFLKSHLINIYLPVNPPTHRPTPAARLGSSESKPSRSTFRSHQFPFISIAAAQIQGTIITLWVASLFPPSSANHPASLPADSLNDSSWASWPYLKFPKDCLRPRDSLNFSPQWTVFCLSLLGTLLDVGIPGSMVELTLSSDRLHAQMVIKIGLSRVAGCSPACLVCTRPWFSVEHAEETRWGKGEERRLC